MDMYGRPDFLNRELITPVRNKRRLIDRMLVDPSYSDNRFNGPNSGAHTIFLSGGLTTAKHDGIDAVEGLFYVYSDRLDASRKHEEITTAKEYARKKVGNFLSAAYFEQVLKIVQDDETIQLGHILSGINHSTLYSYRVFGYASKKQTDT